MSQAVTLKRLARRAAAAPEAAEAGAERLWRAGLVMTADRSVLILCERVAPTQELVLLARAMQDDGRYRPLLVLTSPYLERRLGPAFFSGLPVHRSYRRAAPNSDSGIAAAKAERASPRPRLWTLLQQGLIARLERGALAFPFDFLSALYRLHRGLRLSRRLLREIDPVAVVVSDDRSLGNVSGLLKTARAQGRPTLVVPFAASDPSADALLRRERHALHLDRRPQRRLKDWIAGAMPGQARDTPYGRMLFLSPGTTLAMRLLGLLMPNPWCIGGGLSDRICVFGEYDRRRYLALGLPAEKIAVTGQASLDRLYDKDQRRSEIRSELLAKYDCDPDKPILICAVPAFGEHNIQTPGSRAAYQDEDPGIQNRKDLEYLFRVLVDSGANVLLSLHPRMKRSDYLPFEAQFGLRILEQRLWDVLPAADAFTTYQSSVLLWAVLLGIPTLVLDHYLLNYPMFDRIDGLVTVKDRDELAPQIKRVLSDWRYREELVRRLRISAQNIARFDGRAAVRIIEAIDQTKKNPG